MPKLGPKQRLEERIYRALDGGIQFEDVCFRLVSQRFATREDVISSEGSRRYGGRFNFKGAFGVLYLSCDVHTCVEEGTRGTEDAGFDVANRLPCTIVAIEVKLSRVLDLTDKGVRTAICIKESDLTKANWKRKGVSEKEAITQSIGRFAKEAGFEAILVPSAVWKGGRNLDIFSGKLLPSSHVGVVNSRWLKLRSVDVP